MFEGGAEIVYLQADNLITSAEGFTAGPFIVAAYFDDDATVHCVLSSQ